MKASELLKLVGQTVKLRPAVRRVLPDGHELPSIDDDWRVERSSARRAVIRIHNLATGHVVDLSSDNVYEFRTPNLFVLKEQLTLTAWKVLRDPLPDPRTRYSSPRIRSRLG